MNDYLATINVPGYLPMDDDPPVFDSPAEAWEYLAQERRFGEDAADMDLDDEDRDQPYTQTVNDLDAKAAAALDVNRMGWDGTGNVSGSTPGYDGDHDLGLVYSVTLIEHVNYPHEPGRLYDCPACDARCHCTPGHTECVFEGEHNGKGVTE